MLIYGRNSVNEAVKAGTSINKVIIAEGENKGHLAALEALLRQHGVLIQYRPRRELEKLIAEETGERNVNHQGVAAYLAATQYVQPEEILAAARARGEQPFVLILDGIQDPHNLGAIIRTADAVGVHGVIISKRCSCAVTEVVAKTSAGAVEYLPVARVANIANTIRELKEKGVWVYGTAADADSGLYRTDLTGPAAIVIGNEGEGMSRLVRESCDVLVSIPMKGQISSLNASAAAAVMLYEALRQRDAKR